MQGRMYKDMAARGLEIRPNISQILQGTTGRSQRGNHSQGGAISKGGRPGGLRRAKGGLRRAKGGLRRAKGGGRLTCPRQG